MAEAGLSEKKDGRKAESETISKFSGKIIKCSKTGIRLTGDDANRTALSIVNLLCEMSVHTAILLL